MLYSIGNFDLHYGYSVGRSSENEETTVWNDERIEIFKEEWFKVSSMITFPYPIFTILTHLIISLPLG